MSSGLFSKYMAAGWLASELDAPVLCRELVRRAPRGEGDLTKLAGELGGDANFLPLVGMGGDAPIPAPAAPVTRGLESEKRSSDDDGGGGG